MRRYQSTPVYIVWIFIWAFAILSARSLLADAAKVVLGGTIDAGNAFYIVHVQDIPGSGVGLYTITTGPSHPAGSGLNVLFGGGSPGTSFNTIRSYTSSRDYVQDLGTKTSPNTVIQLSRFGTAAPLGATGVRTTYVLPGPGGGANATPDQLTIVQDVNVNGTTFQDSTVEVTTTVINNGAAAVQVGIRYLWDFQVGLDDGPTFKINNAISPALTTEAQFVNPSFDSYRIQDNDLNPTPPTFNILGTVAAPAGIVPTPTTPDLLEYVCWPSSFGTAFNYPITPGLDVATGAGTCSGAGGGDCAVLYFFGQSAANAISIPPGSQRTVSASLFLTPPKQATPCTTRNARFWFTHAENTNVPNCVTLRNAIVANSVGGLGLGFITLPTLPRYNDVTNTSEIASLEALSFYYRGNGRTGERSGTQNAKLPASALCRARKQLAVELIAATANGALLDTDPSTCTYFNGISITNFPPNLIDQATAAIAGFDAARIKTMMLLLRKFNNSGLTNSFPAGLVQCSTDKASALRTLSRDPTTQLTCPGLNNSCDTAETIVFPNATNLFGTASFGRSISLPSFPASTASNALPATTCGATGSGAMWKITPDVGANGRSFTVDTFGSNCDTLLQVWSGTACTNLIPVICNDNTTITRNGVSFASVQSQVTFTTDGINTFFIAASAANGTTGRVKFHLTSP